MPLVYLNRVHRLLSVVTVSNECQINFPLLFTFPLSSSSSVFSLQDRPSRILLQTFLHCTRRFSSILSSAASFSKHKTLSYDPSDYPEDIEPPWRRRTNLKAPATLFSTSSPHINVHEMNSSRHFRPVKLQTTNDDNDTAKTRLNSVDRDKDIGESIVRQKSWKDEKRGDYSYDNDDSEEDKMGI